MTIKVKTIFNIILFYFLFIKVFIINAGGENSNEEILLLNTFTALTSFGVSMNLMRTVTHHLPEEKTSHKKDWKNLMRSLEVLRYKLKKLIKFLRNNDIKDKFYHEIEKKTIRYYRIFNTNFTHYYNFLLEHECVSITVQNKNLLLYIA